MLSEFHNRCFAGVAALGLLGAAAGLRGDEPGGELAHRLAGVKFELYAAAPGYSEGPTWQNGDVLFCCGGLMRADAERHVYKFLEIEPGATALGADGHLLICDNKNKALLDLAPDGKLGVVGQRFEIEVLRSLNDLTIDARGNVYWTDPADSSVENPVGHIYRRRPDGRLDRLATGLAFPNGIEVDPASKYLYVIESRSKAVLRYDLPDDDDLLGKPAMFFDLGGTGGDGCTFDAGGNLWVADFHRPETGTGRITVLSPTAQVLAHLPLPSKMVSNITFGGTGGDEIFCTTDSPAGVFRAQVGVKGFAGHPGRPLPISHYLNAVTLRPHADAPLLRQIAEVAAAAKPGSQGFDDATRGQMQSLAAGLTDSQVRHDTEQLWPALEQAAIRHAQDQALLAEIKRLGGQANIEVFVPEWLRSIAGDEGLPVFGRLVEIILNERTDGHKEPEPKALADRATDDWLKQLSGQDRLRRLELSGTAITSAGLVHLGGLKNLERLNICLTAVDDRGFEHLANLSHMRRMTVCSSKITGTGFQHLTGLKQLETINLHSAPVSDAGLQAIGSLPNLRRLEIVHIGAGDAGLKHLANLANLEELHVHGMEATTAGLAQIGRLQKLKLLDIHGPAASNQALEQIGQLPELRTLLIFGGQFDDAGVRHLAKVTTLEELSLDSAGVTDAAIESLAGLKRLRNLRLGGAQITPAGRQRLQELLPKLVIKS